MWELVGTGHLERISWELVGTGHLQIELFLGNQSGNSRNSRLYFLNNMGTGGNWSFERN